MEKLDILGTVKAGTTGTIIITYQDSEEPFGTIKLKNPTKDRMVYQYVIIAIDKVFEGVDDLEMAILRKNTNIEDFFNANDSALADEQITALFKDFTVWLS